MNGYRIAHHVAERWLERVDGTLTLAEAGAAVVAFLADAKLSDQPPEWYTPLLPRAFFATNRDLPDVVVVIEGKHLPLAATTVVTRAVADAWRARWRPEQLQPPHFGESFKTRSVQRRLAPPRAATREGAHAEFSKHEAAH